MGMTFKRAVVQSQQKKGLQDVLISEKPKKDGKYRARIGSKLCTAIYDVFVGYYYVDDVYGVIKDYEGTYRVVDYYEDFVILGYCETEEQAQVIAEQRNQDTDGECNISIKKMINGNWRIG